jgi:hypothetical protein
MKLVICVCWQLQHQMLSRLYAYVDSSIKCKVGNMCMLTATTPNVSWLYAYVGSYIKCKVGNMRMFAVDCIVCCQYWGFTASNSRCLIRCVLCVCVCVVMQRIKLRLYVGLRWGPRDFVAHSVSLPTNSKIDPLFPLFLSPQFVPNRCILYLLGLSFHWLSKHLKGVYTASTEDYGK